MKLSGIVITAFLAATMPVAAVHAAQVPLIKVGNGDGLTATVNGTPIIFQLDTGADISSLSYADCLRAGVQGAIGAMKIKGVNGGWECNQGRDGVKLAPLRC